MDLKYIGADLYTNLKADLIARNKIDSVNFDLNSVQRSNEEILDFELKVPKYENNAVVMNGSEVALNEDIKLWNNYFINGRQDVEFKDKKFFVLNNDILFMAILIEPSNNLVYDSQINYERIIKRFNLLPPDGVTSICPSEKKYASIYHVEIADEFSKLGNSPVIYYMNEKQILFLCKTQIFQTGYYTESITITLNAETWTSSKTTYYYRLKGDDDVQQISMNPDGTFAGDFMPQYPFNYPSNELLQYETVYNSKPLHEHIAYELLTDYESGRRCVEFTLPDDAMIPAANIYGGPNDTRLTPAAALDIGDHFILAEPVRLRRRGQGREKKQFVGGSYRKSIEWGTEKDMAAETNIVRRYRVTNIEYKYNGAMSYSVKAVEIPYSRAMEKMLANGLLVDEYRPEEEGKRFKLTEGAIENE